MKPWKKQEVVVQTPELSISWNCVDCDNNATVIYEGTTFCRACLDKFLRSNYRK